MTVKIEKVRGTTTREKYVSAVDGELLPGTTTICDLLGPVGGLGYWGFQVGRSGEVDDYWAYLKGLASAGSAVHAVIEAALHKTEPDLSAFTGHEVEIARSCHDKFQKWASDKDIEIIDSERPLVSEKHRYGGKFDLLMRVNGVPYITDLKSSADIRLSMLVQGSAYKQLADENGLEASGIGVIALGRDPSDPLRAQFVEDTAPYFSIFTNLLEIYRIDKALKKPSRKSREAA